MQGSCGELLDGVETAVDVRCGTCELDTCRVVCIAILDDVVHVIADGSPDELRGCPQRTGDEVMSLVHVTLGQRGLAVVGGGPVEGRCDLQEGEVAAAF